MAEGEEKKSVGVGGGGGDDEKKGKYPTGFRFKPTDEELIEYYLLPRLQGRPSEPNDAIIEANVYECHPDTLINEKYRSRGEGDWFFLSPRARMYQNGIRPSRKTEDGRGRWKASTATKIVEKETVGDGIKFCRNVLNYFVGSPKNERRTKWLMRELTIPEFEIKLDNSGPNNKLDEYVMCKIYVSPVNKGNGDEASTSSAREEARSSSQQRQGTAAESKLSEKQAGKRPVEEQRGCATARKQARPRSLTIGSTQASGAGNVSVPQAGYYGVPGQAVAYNGQAMMPRPPGMHNDQAPVQRPPGGYNGQAPVQRPPVGMQFPTPSAATNPNSFGRTAMMMRPPNLASQAVFPGNPPRQHPGTGYVPRPRVSLNCYYDQNHRAVQPPGNASYGMQEQKPAVFQPPQQQQQPYFNGIGNHHAGGIAPRWPPYNCYPYQCSSMTPAPGAASEGSGTGGCNMNAEHHFVELAAINTSLAGARPQAALVPQAESATPVCAPKLETEMEETT